MAKRKTNFKRIITGVLVALLLVTVVGGIGVFAGKDSTSISASEFSLGALDENGVYVKSEQTLYTKDSFGCIGLRVEPDFEAQLTYDIYYYDYNEQLVEIKSGLTGVYDEDFPLAKLARIVIHPTIPDDVDEDEFKISFLDKREYARQLKITVDKSQNYKYSECQNLYIDSLSTVDKDFKDGVNNMPSMFDSKNLTDMTKAEYPVKVSSAILVDGTVTKYDIFVHLEANEGRWPVAALFNAEGKVIMDDNAYVYAVVDSSSVVKPCWVKMTIEVPSLESYEGVHLMVSMPDDSECYIFGYND